ncbi:hypothetical protein QJS10_CPA06g01820 [Acorus calamus]|uniref:Uncharacterized protein n=1 Tax=Acorus calamus TaxID=4465 RepID=A0AAV9EPY6_ACOCL|nr:hypothetical protein QJS10_CPA06g01820 [Acorus calamus]
MVSQWTSGSREVLEGIHGVRLGRHSPFQVDETLNCGRFHLSPFEDEEAIGTNRGLPIRRIWQQRPACLRPIHCCTQGDQTVVETIANVLTSLPFIVLGIQAPR